MIGGFGQQHLSDTFHGTQISAGIISFNGDLYFACKGFVEVVYQIQVYRMGMSVLFDLGDGFDEVHRGRLPPSRPMKMSAP